MITLYVENSKKSRVSSCRQHSGPPAPSPSGRAAGPLFCFFPAAGGGGNFFRAAGRFGGHVYQMSTKKGGKALGRRGFENFHFLGVYQMSTKVTFLMGKPAFWPVFCCFQTEIRVCKECYTGLIGLKSSPKIKFPAKNREKRPEK